jgi:hypothetical protein
VAKSITLGPDDDGTGGTLPPFFLELAYDTDGVLSASATSLVAAITKVYFVSGPDDGAAPTVADVLAGTVDSSGPPFTAATLATMAVAETRTVGAIGEDALGNRTTLVLSSITRLSPDDVDPGTGSGTPGNLALTWHATPAVVVRNVGATLVEPEAAIPSRRYLNTSAVGEWRDQLANWRASGDVEFHRIFSLDAGATWAEAGPFVALNVARFPKVGDAAALADDAIGNNVLFSWGLKGGDGTDTVKVGNIYSMATTSAQPAPPPETDVPLGGPLGNLLLDLNAYTLLDLATADNTALTIWPDDSGNANDAVEHATTSNRPTFKTAGIDGGKPCVRFNRATFQSLRFPVPSEQEFTLYFLLDNISKNPSVGAGAYPNGSALLQNSVGSSTASFGIAMMSNGHISYGVGENAITTSSNSRPTASSWDDGAKHVHAFTRQPAGGLAAYYVDDNDESTSGINTTGADLTAEPYVYIAWKDLVGFATSLDLGRVLWYDKAHTAAQVVQVTAALRAIWGTP